MEILLLSGKNCTKCVQLKKLLDGKGLIFKEVDMLSKEGMDIVSKNFIKSIPQVFVNNELLRREEYVLKLGVTLD